MSAFGIIVIGAAGLLFQLATERARAYALAQSEQNRTYLPKIRSLAELELALDDVATRLSLGPTKGIHQAPLLLACSSRLESAATSTLVIENDPQVPVELPTLHGISLTSDRRILGVRAAAFMLADLLRVMAFASTTHDVGHNPTIGLVHIGKEWAVDIYKGVEPVRSVKVRQDTVVPWRSWIGDARIPTTRIQQLLRATARALQIQTATEAQKVVTEHPEFGDQYVAIRTELAKRRPLDEFRISETGK